MPQTGTLYLVPIPISDGALHTLSPEIASRTLNIRHYYVENARTARRFLRSLHASLVLEEVEMVEIDKHRRIDTSKLSSWLKKGFDVGVMSEAGCPGIADPGAEVVAAAQVMNAPVIPLTGPNSLILALMASGLNGQSFAFQGYLPVKEPVRSQRIKQLEQLSQKERQTQIFIETPYRNNQLLDDLLRNCQPSTSICIAWNVTAQDQQVRTKKAAEWKKEKPVLEKQPAVFLMLA